MSFEKDITIESKIWVDDEIEFVGWCNDYYRRGEDSIAYPSSEGYWIDPRGRVHRHNKLTKLTTAFHFKVVDGYIPEKFVTMQPFMSTILDSTWGELSNDRRTRRLFYTQIVDGLSKEEIYDLRIKTEIRLLEEFKISYKTRKADHIYHVVGYNLEDLGVTGS